MTAISGVNTVQKDRSTRHSKPADKRKQVSRYVVTLTVLVVVSLLLNCGRRLPPPIPQVSTGSAEPDSTISSDIPVAVPFPELQLSIEPSLIRPGEAALLLWEAGNADRVLINHNIGEVETSGRIKFFPDRTTVYEVTAKGPGGEVVKTARVDVLSDTRVDIREEDLRPLTERFSNFINPIFFKYNSAELTEQAKLTLTNSARWLTSLENVRVRFLIEGHCDERGTEQYNLALGDRRAQATLVYLVRNGVDSSRIETISYGEERPLDPRQSEAGWTLNRRAHFFFLEGPDAGEQPTVTR